MAGVAIPATAGELLLSCAYDKTGLASVELIDHPIIGWVVDEATPPAFASVPSITGTLPPLPPNTAPIFSPAWAVWVPGEWSAVYVADIWHGSFASFCTWLATNNEAERLVGGWELTHLDLRRQWQSWAAANPRLAGSGSGDFEFLPAPGGPIVQMTLPQPVTLSLWLPAPDGGRAGSITKHFGAGEMAVPQLLSSHSALAAADAAPTRAQAG